MKRISYSDTSYIQLLYEFKYCYYTLAKKAKKLLDECEKENKEYTRAWFHYKQSYDKWCTCANVVDLNIRCFTQNSTFSKWYKDLCVNKNS